MPPRVQRIPSCAGDDPEQKREEIRRYFHNTYDVYERLFDVIAEDEAFYRRADPLRHPLIFYLGHTATFFVNKLMLAKFISERIDARFESLFAVGVDEMSWDDLDERNYDWPEVAEVWAYRKQVRALVDRMITELPLELPIGWDDPFWVILMGCEHERIHLETSSVLIRQLPLDLLRTSEAWPVCTRRGDAPSNDLVLVPASRIALGKQQSHPLYGWDNEYGRLEMDVPAFRAARYLVSNGEYREFVEAGGYSTPDWWTEEGRRWCLGTQVKNPRFWVRDGSTWRLRCMAEEIPMPWDWPVEVNQLEAKAFCNWKAAETGSPIRLPTEDEWYRLLAASGVQDQPAWDEQAPGNINLEVHASSCPVTDHSQGEFGDVLGNVWQWTETAITGYPGFRVHPLYDDFSTPTFDAKHNLIKGGSWISTGNAATLGSRYAFRRHFYQHAGLRYVETDTPIPIHEDVYESDALVAQYCEFHYGEDYFGVPNFPASVAALCRALFVDRPARRALDLGCATGRSTFELAHTFDHVTGIDLSARFIRVGHELQRRGFTRYSIPEEGELVTYRERSLAELGLAGLEEKVEFWQGDAHNLKPQYRDYDLILACNLIDRLYDPARWLEHVYDRLAPGGVLVLASPYTWLEEFTPRELWLGGKKVDGESRTTLDALHLILEPRFRRLEEPRDVEFVIRETARKFQHTRSQLTVWERVS